MPSVRRFHLQNARLRGLRGSKPVLNRRGLAGVFSALRRWIVGSMPARADERRHRRGGRERMLDIIIQGGDVVTPQGVARCDVAIAGETIAAIAAPGALPAQSAGRVIDASGRIVMPGGIDPHVHLHHVWIKPDGTTLTTAGPEQVG